MKEKAKCSECNNCVPNLDASSKREFNFPEDYECLMEWDLYPDSAHVCPDFIYVVE